MSGAIGGALVLEEAGALPVTGGGALGGAIGGAFFGVLGAAVRTTAGGGGGTVRRRWRSALISCSYLAIQDVSCEVALYSCLMP